LSNKTAVKLFVSKTSSILAVMPCWQAWHLSCYAMLASGVCDIYVAFTRM